MTNWATFWDMVKASVKSICGSLLLEDVSLSERLLGDAQNLMRIMIIVLGGCKCLSIKASYPAYHPRNN